MEREWDITIRVKVDELVASDALDADKIYKLAGVPFAELDWNHVKSISCTLVGGSKASADHLEKKV